MQHIFIFARSTKSFTIYGSATVNEFTDPGWIWLHSGKLPDELNANLCEMALHSFELARRVRARFVKFVAEDAHGIGPDLNYIGLK